MKQPIIYKIEDNMESLRDFEKNLLSSDEEKLKKVILSYPTVYIHNWLKNDNYEVYVGESNNIVQRTKQHFDKTSEEDKWQENLYDNEALLYIIGHEHFNKSMTLDIENRLMHYMMSVDGVKKVHNLRENPQTEYYPIEEMDEIFSKIWRKLRKYDKELFPLESKIKDSAIFKASPLHKLTLGQENAKNLILEKVKDSLAKQEKEQLIFIDGEAGTGKTVLNSSTFYEMFCINEESNKKIDCHLLVNHDEQITVYEQIANKLGITDKYGKVVSKPTSFINNHDPSKPVDVVFVDEAHLLLTQGKQSYTGKNQLQDIIDRSRVTVVMFDENQILTTEQYWEMELLEGFRDKAKQQKNYIELTEQLRMQADSETVDWIDSFTKEGIVKPINTKNKNYSIEVFDSPAELEKQIKKKASNESTALSRLIATYDWDYNQRRREEFNNRINSYWEVVIGNWKKPWNRELDYELDSTEKKKLKGLSWAEQPQTINEVGSTFTIQGFDLNYAGVILGPSVKYRDGRILLDPEESKNKKATQNRTLSNKTKQKFGEELLKHEVRVLMTRGVNGLYIYACDDELRKALKAAVEE